jgi:hypothetical protein
VSASAMKAFFPFMAISSAEAAFVPRFNQEIRA